jgi:hypothetical protein
VIFWLKPRFDSLKSETPFKKNDAPETMVAFSSLGAHLLIFLAQVKQID